MRKILSLALIVSFGFSTTRVVCTNLVAGRCWCNPTVSNAYDKIKNALNDANKGDEIEICPGNYDEYGLQIKKDNIYFHSKNNNPTQVKIYNDKKKDYILRIRRKGTVVEGITFEEDKKKYAIYISNKKNVTLKNSIINSDYIGIRVTNNFTNLKISDVNITSKSKALYIKKDLLNSSLNKLKINSSTYGIYIKGDNENNIFNELNITSKNRCFNSNGVNFENVRITNSEFNQTGGEYAFATQASNFKNDSLKDMNITSSGYGLYFDKGMSDTNFTNFYLASSDDAFVANSGDIDNIKFIDSNLSSKNGRAISVNNGSLIDSEFNDFNLSANYEAIYTNDDIDNSMFKNFKISGSYAFYVDRYLKNSTIENGEINTTYAGIYSSKEFNQSTLNNLKIKAPYYGLWFSENSDSGAVNDENNLTDLLIIQTSDGNSDYSGIKFRKKVNNSLFNDVNISATERGIWLSTGGKYNTFENSEFNSSKSNGFVNSNPIIDNSFTNCTFYSNENNAISFNGDVESNSFDTIYVESNQSNGIYSKSGVNIDNNDFKNFKIFADNYGIYFKDDISDNNFTKVYVRVNKYSFKLAKNSTDDYFLNIDLNGTKGIEFNISKGDVVQKANIVTNGNEPLYFSTVSSNVALYDLNLTSTKDNCIYVANLNADLNISTKMFYKNELNCSVNNGIQISNYSNSDLRVFNTNLKINASSVKSRGLIYAKSLNALYVKNDSFDGNDTRRGIYISSNLNNLYVYNSLFKNANDAAVYINKVNDNVDIEDNNFSNSEEYGIYIYSVDSGFNKGEIKRNYFVDNKDYAVDIFNNNEKSANFEIWTNCFYDNQDTSGDSQAYTYDSNAKYDDGKAGNFWSDWNESGKYKIDPIPIYDNHPLYYCPLNVLFDARDADRNFTDRNISIKIAGKDFNLTVFDITGGEYTGTVCSRILDNDDNNTAYTGWMRQYFNNEVEKNLTDIEVNNSVPDAIVHIVWAGGDRSCEDVLNNDHNASFSTDTFAIRPYKYKVKLSKMPLFAGEAFDLNVSSVDFNKNLLDDYNESDVNISVDMNRSSLICDYPHAEFNLSTINFTNGVSNNNAKFDEVGEMNLTVFDNHFDEAKGGSDECNDSNECVSVYGYDGKDSKGVFCCNIEANPKLDVNLSEVDIRVYDLNITRDDINTSNNKDWIYMDNNLSEFNASPTIEITEYNKEGKQLHNFDKLCLAKDMNISFKYNVHNDNGDINLIYKGTVDDNNKSINDFNKTMEVNKSIFVKGDTNASYAFNVERNSSKALYVVYGNLKEINFTTNGIAKNENNLSTDLNISMYYGNVKTFDVSTNKDNIDVKVYFTVYDDDSNYKPSNINKAYNWYLNTKHTKKEGEFNSTVHISDGYTASDKYNDKFDINVSKNVSDGSQVFHIHRKDDSINFAVFHLTLDSNASHWLWFSYSNKDYNDSNGSTCANHFCFAITWNEASNEGNNTKTVTSGDVLGTEANVSEYNSTAKGVKIYR